MKHAHLIANLLELASDEFANHGCNDHPLPDTPENRELWDEMVKENGEDPEDYCPITGKGMIYFQDWWLMSFFADKLRAGVA